MGIGEWWATLDAVTKGFYIAATFFSVLFIWQLIATLVGLGGGEHLEVDHGDMEVAHADVDAHVGLDHAEVAPGEHPEFEHGAAVDAAETMAAFKLLSLRSILAFCMLFSWAGALYLGRRAPVPWAMLYALGWGLGAMVLVALLFYGMRRMTEAGTPRIASCVGTGGTVHLNIPAGGEGEARVTISGVLSHVKARGAGGQEIRAGTPIRVTRILGPSTIEVAPVGDDC